MNALANQTVISVKIDSTVVGAIDYGFVDALLRSRRGGPHWPICVGGEHRRTADRCDIADRSPIDVGPIIGHFPSYGK